MWSEGNKSHFAFIVKDGETGIWRHIITWSTPEANLKFSGSYCFIEDWRGDGEYRESQLRKGWNRSSSTENWTPLTTYKYNINDGDIAPGGRSYNKRTNWCGGKKSDATGEFFYMGAGGSVACTNNDNTNYTIARTETSPQEEYGIHRISDLKAIMFDGNNKLAIDWKWDSTTVPQYAYFITVKDGNTTVLTKSDTIPEKRSDTLDISSLTPASKLYSVTFEVIDFFDGNSDPKMVTFGDGSVSLKDNLGIDNNKISIMNLGDKTIITNGQFNKNWNLNLFSVNGKLLYSKKNIDTPETTLNNNTLGISSGVYVFRINNSNRLINFK